MKEIKTLNFYYAGKRIKTHLTESQIEVVEAILDAKNVKKALASGYVLATPEKDPKKVVEINVADIKDIEFSEKNRFYGVLPSLNRRNIIHLDSDSSGDGSYIVFHPTVLREMLDNAKPREEEDEIILPIDEKVSPYRISLTVDGRLKPWIQNISWKRHECITKYIERLIRADRKKYYENGGDTRGFEPDPWVK